MTASARIGLVVLVASLSIAHSAPAVDDDTLKGQVGPAVAMVIASDSNGQPLALGSGFFVDDDGSLATNLHIVQGAAAVRVRLSNGSVHDVHAVAAYDTAHDLVLLVTQARYTSFLTPSKDLGSAGDDVIAVGNPQGLGASTSSGIISGVILALGFHDGMFSTACRHHG